MSRNRSRTLPIGTISEGTLRPEDIVPELLYLGRNLRMSRADRKTFAEIERSVSRFEEPDEDDPDGDYGYQEVLDELYALLDNYCPDFCYLGSTEGDGACIGVWLVSDFRQQIEDEGGLVTPDANGATMIPSSHIGYVLAVSDHGNATLMWKAKNGRTRVLWSIV